jgi:hypothetical protein
LSFFKFVLIIFEKGGLIGRIEGGDIIIDNSYSRATVNAVGSGNIVGGLIGITSKKKFISYMMVLFKVFHFNF